MRKKLYLYCDKINQNIYLTFEVVNFTQINEELYKIGKFRQCSVCNNICDDCS